MEARAADELRAEDAIQRLCLAMGCASLAVKEEQKAERKTLTKGLDPRCNEH
jgi:hypothetical protein